MVKTVLIILIIVLLIVLVIVSFTSSLVKDLLELKEHPLQEKFEVLIGGINNALYNGAAQVVTFPDDKRTVNLFYDGHANMIITFFYSSGKMRVTLRYKYFHQEMTFEKVISNMRNASSLQQKDYANTFAEEALERIKQHQIAVASYDTKTDVVDETYNEDDPMTMVASQFASLSSNQKMSFINLLYVIAKADGCSDTEASREIVLLNQLAVFNLKWDKCHDYYLQTGDSGIVNDLSCNNIASQAKDLIIFTSFCITNGIEARTEKMFEMLDLIGVSRDYASNTIEKIELLSKMFS